MIYCRLIDGYVDQEIRCFNCRFYEGNADICMLDAYDSDDPDHERDIDENE